MYHVLYTIRVHNISDSLKSVKIPSNSKYVISSISTICKKLNLPRDILINYYLLINICAISQVRTVSKIQQFYNVKSFSSILN